MTVQCESSAVLGRPIPREKQRIGDMVIYEYPVTVWDMQEQTFRWVYPSDMENQGASPDNKNLYEE